MSLQMVKWTKMFSFIKELTDTFTNTIYKNFKGEEISLKCLWRECIRLSSLFHELILNLTVHDSWLLGAQLTLSLSAPCVDDSRQRSNNMYEMTEADGMD